MLFLVSFLVLLGTILCAVFPSMVTFNNDSNTGTATGPEQDQLDICTEAETETCAGVRASSLR